MKDPEFWHAKWAANQIGFHLEDVNPLLIEYWSHTKPSREDKVFVPLCGKSEDLVWLATKHDKVQGVELSLIAVRAFFAEHFYTPMVVPINGQHELYQFDELSIYSGDFFNAPVEPVDIVYDRASLVALPKEMRQDYVDRIKGLLEPGARILLITLDYDQSLMAGPPFAVAEQEVRHLFDGMRITKLNRNENADMPPKLAKVSGARMVEEVYLIEA